PNTWTAVQTFNAQTNMGANLNLTAGQLNAQGNLLTTAAGKLDATQLVNTVPAADVNGAYAGITGVGTLTAGTWNASVIDMAHGARAPTSPPRRGPSPTARPGTWR